MNTVLGIDVSGYQDPERMNYKELYDHGFRFVVVKLDQYLTEEHITLARAAGLEVGGYFWNDPLDAPAYQAARILNEVKRLGLRFAALDVEQWWSDWDAWWKAIQKQIPWTQVPHFTPLQIANNAGQVMALVKDAITVPWMVYTARWFTDAWAGPIMNWIGAYQSWVAQYIQPAVGMNNHITWEQLQALPGSSVLRPLAGSTPKIWQVSGSFIYPGRSYDAYDTNLFLGSQADLDAWLQFPAPDPEFIPYRVKTTAYNGLRVRDLPSIQGNILGKLWPGSAAVTILEEQDGFGRFCGGWIFLSWTKRV